jgi:hypothetical protein
MKRLSPAVQVGTLRPPAGCSTVRGRTYSPCRPQSNANRAIYDAEAGAVTVGSGPRFVTQGLAHRLRAPPAPRSGAAVGCSDVRGGAASGRRVSRDLRSVRFRGEVDRSPVNVFRATHLAYRPRVSIATTTGSGASRPYWKGSTMFRDPCAGVRAASRRPPLVSGDSPDEPPREPWRLVHSSCIRGVGWY